MALSNLWNKLVFGMEANIGLNYIMLKGLWFSNLHTKGIFPLPTQKSLLFTSGLSV